MCSRGKTLTVQGLWVCKKTGRSVEMHLQALELLTFRYAYKTVLNQSKQKKKKKKAEAVLCTWTLTSTLLFTHLQFMSSHHHQPPPCCLTPSASWRGRDGVRRRTKRRKEKGASGPMHIFYLTFTWSRSSSRLSLTAFWHHWKACFELNSTELMVRVKLRKTGQWYN